MSQGKREIYINNGRNTRQKGMANSGCSKKRIKDTHDHMIVMGLLVAKSP